MSNQNPTALELALIRMLTQPMPEQLGEARIAAIMDGILSDHRRQTYDPKSFSQAETPKPKRGTGWVDPGPLTPPPGDEHIARLTGTENAGGGLKKEKKA